MADSQDVKAKILLAEDDHTIAHVVQRVLEGNQNFSVTWVKDGEAALEQAAQVAPDLFLLDLMMPRRNGFEVCRRLRADERWAQVPICILTALTDPQAHQAAMDAGANKVLLKPFRSGELRQAVRELIHAPAVAAAPPVVDKPVAGAPGSAPAVIPELMRLLAHDLRGPLTVFTSSLSFLETARDDAERHELVVGLRDATDRICAMIDSLVAMGDGGSSLESLPRDEAIEVGALLATLLEEYAYVFEARELKTEFIAQPGDSVVMGNRSLLRSALSNAILNAADYSPLGGKIVVSLLRDGAELNVHIRDEGPGVPPDVVQQVFDLRELAPLKAKGVRIGKGLGLLTVKTAAELHGGFVDIRSEPDLGTELVVTLPLRDGLTPQRNATDRSGSTQLAIPIRLQLLVAHRGVEHTIYTRELNRGAALVDSVPFTARALVDVRVPEFPAAVASAEIGETLGDSVRLYWRDRNGPFEQMLGQIYRTVPGAVLLG
ncbi:MAG: response regulator [Myxococcota bacterium]|nr:response regulator [Myxococcota bacterium]